MTAAVILIVERVLVMTVRSLTLHPLRDVKDVSMDDNPQIAPFVVLVQLLLGDHPELSVIRIRAHSQSLIRATAKGEVLVMLPSKDMKSYVKDCVQAPK